jgi:hypothetical protein
VAGAAHKEAGRQVEISFRTIEIHRKRIMEARRPDRGRSDPECAQQKPGSTARILAAAPTI